MPATNNTKRQHPFVSKACEACKIAHTKCDEEKPCSRCSRLSIECVPATKTRKDYRKNVSGRKVINHPSGSSSASHHHHPHTHHNHSLFVHEFKVEQLQSSNDNDHSVIDRHEQVMEQDNKSMISSKNRKVSADTHRFHYYQPDSQRLQKRSKIDHHGGTNVASSMSSSSSSPFFHQATTTTTTTSIDTNGDDHDDNNSNSSSSSSSNSGSSDVMMTSPTTATTTITAGITTATNMRNMASQQLGYSQTAANNTLHQPRRISIGSDDGPLLLEEGLRLDLEDLNRSLSSSSSSSSSSPSTFDFTLTSQDTTNYSDMMSMILSMNDPIMRYEAVHKILNENVALKKEIASMKMVNEALQTELHFYKSQQLSIQTIDDVSNVIRRCMTGFYNGIGVILTAQNGQIVGMNSYLRWKLGYEQLTFRQGLLQQQQQQQQQIGPSASWQVSANDIILKSWRNLLRVDSAYASRMAYVGCATSQNSIFRVHNPVFLRKFCIVNENARLRPLTDLRYDIDGSMAQDQQFHLQTTNDLETAKYLESHMVYSNGKPLMVVTFVFFEEKSDACKS